MRWKIKPDTDKKEHSFNLKYQMKTIHKKTAPSGSGVPGMNPRPGQRAAPLSWLCPSKGSAKQISQKPHGFCPFKNFSRQT